MQEENKNVPLLERLKQLEDTKEPKKKKEWKMPRRGRLSKSKMKKGYVTIIKLGENRSIDFEKQEIRGSTFRLRDKTYHATSDEAFFFYKGKPVLLQPEIKINPLGLKELVSGKNEVYGQKYIMARMLGDVIKQKAKGALPLLYLIGLGIGAYVLYSLFTGGF